MKKCIYFLLISMTHLCASAQKNSYTVFFKTWNYLKYYHPDFATGKLNADSLFLQDVKKITATTDHNAVIALLTNNLQQHFSTAAAKATATDVIKSNQDFSWFRESAGIDKGHKQLLENIYQHRFTGPQHYYIPNNGYEADIPHEKVYDFPKEENLPLEYRLLALAKIQGCIDYLYPHKQLMNKNFDAYFESLLSRTINCQSRKDFEIILAKLVAPLEDTHAFSFYKQLHFAKDIFHTKLYAPFDYSVFDHYLLVTKLMIPDACQKAGIHAGDRIVAVNGKSIQDIIRSKKELLSASNRSVLLYRLSQYQDNLIWPDDAALKKLAIQRNNSGDTVETAIEFIKPTDKKHIDSIVQYLNDEAKRKRQHRLEHPGIAYFRIDQTYKFISGVADDHIDQTMDSLLLAASQQKAIVFDMRGYPDWGGFVYTYIYKYFADKDNYFGKYYQQNHQNIGTFIYADQPAIYFPVLTNKSRHTYNGKVFIIVNPQTLSASEWNTMNLQYIFPGSVTIGQQSAGADGDIKRMALPGNYSLEFTGNGIFYPGGAPAQKVGVHIDEKITYRDIDLLKGQDLEFDWIIKEIL